MSRSVSLAVRALLAAGALVGIVRYATAETMVEYSSEARFQLDLHVPDAALAAFLPTGWTLNVAAQGAAKDANLRAVFIDRLTINGPDGKPVMGAFVIAENPQTRMSVNVISDAEGRYHINNLSAASYTLRIRAIGYASDPREKVALAGALVHDPRLIILDEPLTGLDALSARHVKGLLQERVRAGCTVIMTTHILEVAERMADRIGVIAAGRLIAEGTLAELREQNGRNDTTLEDMFIALVDTEAAAA